MRVLIGCENSGVVREAFRALGHDAWSCDLLPSEAPGPHIQKDVLEVMHWGWDLMIAHPPCTYLSYAGTAHWNKPGRLQKRLETLQFFADSWEAPIERICLENPKSCASPVIAKYSQEIQPWQFGDGEQKTTWSWLKNLPLLVPTTPEATKPKPKGYNKSGKALHFTEYCMFNDDRWKIRSRTFPGIARTMAEQWGGDVW